MVTILIVTMLSWVYMYVKTYQIVHFKYVHFMLSLIKKKKILASLAMLFFPFGKAEN